jgi:hypothetical protein
MNRSQKTLMFLAILFLVSSSSYAATTETITISGIVPVKVALTVSTEASATSLPLGTEVSNLKLASVKEFSNAESGYAVTISTASGGMLKGKVSNDSLAYSLSYGGIPVVFESRSAVISDASTKLTNGGGAKDLAISFAAQILESDSYSDILTLTIESK